MSRRKQAKPRSLVVAPEDELNTEDVAADLPVKSAEDRLPSQQVSANQSQHDCISPALEPAEATDTESADRASDVNMASNNCPPGGAPLLDGVFHCEVCSREFDSLNRFMDHRNKGCVSSENESDLSMGSQPCQSSPLSTASPSHPDWCCALSPGATPIDQTPFSVGPTDDYPFTCQFCEKSFAKVDHLKRHEQGSHNEKTPHKCDVCSRQFRHKRSRDRHTKLHTGDRKYRCPHCRIAFSRSDRLKMHLKTHVTSSSTDTNMCQHADDCPPSQQCSPGGSTSSMRRSSQVFSCGQCFQSFREVSEMDSHVCVQRTSPERTVSDKTATGQELSENGDRRLGDKEDDGMLTRRCPLCSMCFHDMEQFYSHLTSHELDEKISVRTDRDGHKDVAVVDGALYKKGSPTGHPCLFCKQEFDQVDLLETHMQLMHAGKSDHLFSCQFCELAFSSMHWLSEHVADCHHDLFLSHGTVAQRPSLSPGCHPALTETPTSNNTSANIVFCSQCSVGFPDIYALGQHIQRVHGFSTSSPHDTSPPALKKRLVTPRCSSVVKDSVPFHPYKDAKKKKNTTTQQSYMCDYCSAVFTNVSSYQTHLKYHERETSMVSGNTSTPYVCQECDATFSQEDDLKSHTFTHYLIVATEYGCTSCLKLFTKPDELQKHLMDIHAHHLYRCALCKDVFDSKVNIQVHFAIKHSNECKLFRCARCRSVFRSEMEWQLHVKVHHLGISDPYRCFLCKDSFSIEAELEAHLEATHKKQFVCPICDNEAFHVEYLLDKHMQQKHSVNVSSPRSPQFLNVISASSAVSVSCESPTAETLKLLTSSRHSVTELISPKTSQLYKCEICDLKFAEEMALKRHHGNSHNIKCDKDLIASLKPETPPLKPSNHTQEKHHMMGRSWSNSAGSNDRAAHQCVRCSKTLKTRGDLEKHMKMHHHVQQHQQQHHATGSSSHKCNICDEIFTSANILAAHKLTHCKVVQGNVCVVCKVSITCEDQFYSHTQQHSVHTANMQCIVCRQTLVSMLELQMHGKHHFQTSSITPSSQLYTCCLCLKNFDTKENLISKLNSSEVEYHICKPCFHGETPLTLTPPTTLTLTPPTEHGQCVTCGVKFETDAQLKAHMAQHQKTYQCIKCQQTFASEYDIQIHVATHVMHEGNIHQCHLCDTLCESPAKLQCHLIQHTFATSDMTCSVCSATFNQASAIQLHVLEHGIGVRPYSCSECQQKFFFSAELQNHLYSHQLPRQPVPPSNSPLSTQNVAKKAAINTDHKGDADILCSLCPKMFGSMANMKHHYLVAHSNIESIKPKMEIQQQEKATNGEVAFTKTGKMHSCPECHKEFDMAKHLTAHLRLYHNIGKPFDCNICGKRFSRKDNCKAHMKCHQGALRCPVCDKTFQRQMVLEEHMTSHFKQPLTSAGTYTCELCGEMFAHSKYLQSHLVTAHEEHSSSNPECQVCSAVFSSVIQLKDHLQKDHDRDMKGDLTDLMVKNGSPVQRSNGTCDDYTGSNGQLLQDVKAEQMDTNSTDLVNNTASNMIGQSEQLTVM